MSWMKRTPMQPLIWSEGVLRFKPNAVVRYLLDHGGLDMNTLAGLPFSNEDRRQFLQLIGYSLSGYGEYDYVSDEDYSRAEQQAPKKTSLRTKTPRKRGTPATDSKMPDSHSKLPRQ